MSSIDISVILPVYNRENLIGKCIESVLNQDDISTEIIIIDDGSTDNSLKVCTEYANQYNNIRIIHQDNKGISASRNAGLDVTKGDFICFLDSDDLLVCNTLRFMLDAIKMHNVNAVIGLFDKATTDGQLIEAGSMPDDYKNRTITENDFWELNSRKQNNFTFTVVWGKLYKRSIWSDLRFDESVRFAEDELILPKLVNKCRTFYLLDKSVYIQTISDTSLSRSPFNINKLISPESKLITCQYLMQKELYSCSVEKWGIAVGEILLMAKLVKDKESKKKINDLNSLICRIGRSLFKYMSFNKKLKFVFYLILNPILLNNFTNKIK